MLKGVKCYALKKEIIPRICVCVVRIGWGELFVIVISKVVREALV